MSSLLLFTSLVSLVVLIVLFTANIHTLITIGLGLIIILERWSDPFLVHFGVLATLLAVLAILIMDREKDKKEGLIIFATLGMIILVSAEDFITVYLAIELQSLAFYTLAGYKRQEQYSAEAGLKYFVLGALASGLFLFGVSIIYGLTGLLHFADLHLFLCSSQYPGVLLGALAIIISILFKIGAAPFHMWLPDVYQGSPTISTALFAIAPKLSLLILLVRLYLSPFYALFPELSLVFSLCAFASMLVGAFAALNQSYIKRLLAYSTIAHVGYVLLAIAVGSFNSVSSLLVYIILYIITSITIFTLLLALIPSSNNFLYLIGFTGLSRVHPVLAASLAISLLSLAGLPPLSGFFGKWLIFSSAIHSGFYILSLVGILTSVVSAYYYLRLIKLMYFQDSPFFHSTVLIQALTPSAPVTLSFSFLLGFSTFITLFFIFFPTPLYLMSHLASLSFFL